jgi:hypothetical protein
MQRLRRSALGHVVRRRDRSLRARRRAPRARQLSRRGALRGPVAIAPKAWLFVARGWAERRHLFVLLPDNCGAPARARPREVSARPVPRPRPLAARRLARDVARVLGSDHARGSTRPSSRSTPASSPCRLRSCIADGVEPTKYLTDVSSSNSRRRYRRPTRRSASLSRAAVRHARQSAAVDRRSAPAATAGCAGRVLRNLLPNQAALLVRTTAGGARATALESSRSAMGVARW